MHLDKNVLLCTVGAALMTSINAALNDQCTTGTCTVINSNCDIADGCQTGYCRCKKGYAYTAADTCTKIVKVDEACVDNVFYADNCGRNAYCSGGTCKCSTGYSKESVDCKWTEEVAFGGTCQYDRDCEAKTHDSRCINGVCACEDMQKHEGGVCQPNDYESTCSTSKPCYLTLSCTDGECLCTNSSHERTTISIGRLKGTICIHPSFRTKKGKGETCNMDFYQRTPDFGDENGELCKDGYMCNSCPGSPNTNICISGAAMPTASLISALILVLLAYLP